MPIEVTGDEGTEGGNGGGGGFFKKLFGGLRDLFSGLGGGSTTALRDSLADAYVRSVEKLREVDRRHGLVRSALYEGVEQRERDFALAVDAAIAAGPAAMASAAVHQLMHPIETATAVGQDIKQTATDYLSAVKNYPSLVLEFWRVENEEQATDLADRVLDTGGTTFKVATAVPGGIVAAGRLAAWKVAARTIAGDLAATIRAVDGALIEQGVTAVDTAVEQGMVATAPTLKLAAEAKQLSSRELGQGSDQSAVLTGIHDPRFGGPIKSQVGWTNADSSGNSFTGRADTAAGSGPMGRTAIIDGKAGRKPPNTYAQRFGYKEAQSGTPTQFDQGFDGSNGAEVWHVNSAGPGSGPVTVWSTDGTTIRVLPPIR